MKEKVKKILLNLSYRTAVAAGLFLAAFAISRFADGTFQKISAIWTKEADLLKAGALLKELITVLI